MDLELIEDHKDYYLVKDDKGEEVKLFKINKEELDNLKNEQNLRVAEKLSFQKLMNLYRGLEVIIQTKLLIEDYATAAQGIVDKLRKCYDEVGSPNLFHHYIKDIDPEMYGRAQTFRKETNSLYERVKEIVELKRGLK